MSIDKHANILADITMKAKPEDRITIMGAVGAVLTAIKQLQSLLSPSETAQVVDIIHSNARPFLSTEEAADVVHATLSELPREQHKAVLVGLTQMGEGFAAILKAAEDPDTVRQLLYFFVGQAERDLFEREEAA